MKNFGSSDAPPFDRAKTKAPAEILSEVKNEITSSKITAADNIGLWVSYMNLNISEKENPEKHFKDKFSEIIEKSKKFGVNNLYVHVRPFCDALYPSQIFPFSHLITGNQGENPNFDPLKYMVQTCHENGIKFHAWVNPLRIKLKNIPETLSGSNPYFKFGHEYFLESEGSVCLNPGYEETRKLVADGAKEIAENYDVDGIHFDDYFYPEALSVKDSAFEKSGENDLATFRKKCVTALIKEVSTAVKSVGANVQFGISPLGNKEKCILAGLDAEEICKQKYVDYICPQLYWSLDFPMLPFEKAARVWKDVTKNTSVKLFAGLALYKIGTDLDDGTWKNDKEILIKEYDILKNLGYDGATFYSYAQLDFSKTEISNLAKVLNHQANFSGNKP